jgi:hypothetical protein
VVAHEDEFEVVAALEQLLEKARSGELAAWQAVHIASD